MRIKEPIRFRWKVINGIFGIVLLCSLYEVATYRQHKFNPKDTTVPSFSQLAHGFVEIVKPRPNLLRSEAEEMSFIEGLKTSWLYRDAIATFSRLFEGLILGSMLSILVGLAMGCITPIGAMFKPTFSGLAKVPPTSALSIFFMFANSGDQMYIAIIGFGILPVLVIAICSSVEHDVHDEEINKAYTLGASNSEVVWNVVFPQMLPKLLESIRHQIGAAMVYLIAAEIYVSQVGFGYQMRLQTHNLNIAVVFDYILILMCTGLLMDQGMLSLRRKLCPWFSRYR